MIVQKHHLYEKELSESSNERYLLDKQSSFLKKLDVGPSENLLESVKYTNRCSFVASFDRWKP